MVFTVSGLHYIPVSVRYGVVCRKLWSKRKGMFIIVLYVVLNVGKYFSCFCVCSVDHERGVLLILIKADVLTNS